MIAFEIRAALPGDDAALTALARHLNSVNLPADASAISKILQTSQESFARVLPKEKRAHVFVLEDLDAGKIVGTSTLIGQLGRPDAPYIFFDVDEEERYSPDLNIHFRHSVLRLGFSYDGPTELGGLVVDPSYRRSPGRLGLCVSYVRLLFIAAHRGEFRDQLLAELLPPLEPDGTSHLWNALGRRFTHMTYRQADRLSHENKDFIRDLFPRGPVYASLLSEAAQGVIGKVGHQTKGVEKMLQRIGFRYADRVDPFDGGPHFTAKTDEVSVIRGYRALKARPIETASTEGPAPRGESGENQAGGNASSEMASRQYLVAHITPDAPFLRAVSTHGQVDGEQVALDAGALAHLGITAGDVVQLVPVP